MSAPLNVKLSHELQGSCENYALGSSGYGVGLVLSDNETSEKSWCKKREGQSWLPKAAAQRRSGSKMKGLR